MTRTRYDLKDLFGADIDECQTSKPCQNGG